MRGCMGGWCKQRDLCQVYALGGDDPHERACYSNADGKSPDAEVAKVLSLQRLVKWKALTASDATARDILPNGCAYPSCVENEDERCPRWLTGECAGPRPSGRYAR